MKNEMKNATFTFEYDYSYTVDKDPAHPRSYRMHLVTCNGLPIGHVQEKGGRFAPDIIRIDRLPPFFDTIEEAAIPQLAFFKEQNLKRIGKLRQQLKDAEAASFRLRS